MNLFRDWIESSKLFNRADSAAGLSQIQTVYATFAVCWLVFLVFGWTGIDLPRKKLKCKDTIEWHSRVISSIHAIILCGGKRARRKTSSADAAWHIAPDSGNIYVARTYPRLVQVPLDAMWKCKGRQGRLW